eukprot:Mycagemm_TRINITY_DN8133_c0_g1::TRINITY_DN8133_c0_g1_i1::g.21::m.21 type:complete len:198 gc:universal TRINITY_DN8133_c0_g1_i1:158-751(+)
MHNSPSRFATTPPASHQPGKHGGARTVVTERVSNEPIEITYLGDLYHPVSVQNIIAPTLHSPAAQPARGGTEKRQPPPLRSPLSSTIPREGSVPQSFFPHSANQAHFPHSTGSPLPTPIPPHVPSIKHGAKRSRVPDGDPPAARKFRPKAAQTATYIMRPRRGPSRSCPPNRIRQFDVKGTALSLEETRHDSREKEQ